MAAEASPPVDTTAPPGPLSLDGADDQVEVASESEGRREEQQGWGLRDWLDAAAKVDREVIAEAERIARRRVTIDPDSPSALGALAYYQYLSEAYDEAEKTFDRFIEKEPEDPGGYNNKALVYKRRGEYVREEGLYRVALALDRGDVVAMNNLAVCLAHQGRFAEALALMKELETLDPDNPYADLHRAKIHAAMGSDEVALSYVARALSRMEDLDVMHHIEFRQDIRLDPVFSRMRGDGRFLALLLQYYGDDIPIPVPR